MQDNFSSAAQPRKQADDLHKQSNALWTKLRLEADRDSEVKDYSGVYALLDKGLALDPSHTGCLHIKGCVLYWDGRKAEAEECLKAALAIDPAMRPAVRFLTGMLDKSGRGEEAIPFLEAAAKADPESAVAWFELGDELLATGSFAKALAAFTETLKVENSRTGGEATFETCWAQYRIGETREALGDIPSARRAFTEAAAMAEAIHLDAIQEAAQDNMRRLDGPKPGGR